MSRSTNSISLPAAFVAPTNSDEIKRIESANAVRQFDAGVAMIQVALQGGKRFRLRPSDVYSLNSFAVGGMQPTPGVCRTCPVFIEGSSHQPPPATEVQRYVEEFCDYVTDHWDGPAVHLAAYLLWRVNWVHPFTDGNGRTSRMIAYVVLCIRAGTLLPGSPTIPDQISSYKAPYYQALDAADAAYKTGQTIDVSLMEQLVTRTLAVQLQSFFDATTQP